jgi:hypothetical protein
MGLNPLLRSTSINNPVDTIEKDAPSPDLLGFSLSTILCHTKTLSRMNMPLIYNVWFEIITGLAIGSCLVAKAFKITLKMTLIRETGINYEI